jgi:hypothetical protein
MKLVSTKVKTDNANRTVQFPVIGVATFDKDGFLEVDDKVAAEFIEATVPSFDFVEVGKKVEPRKSTKDPELTEAQLAELQDFSSLLSVIEDEAGLRNLIAGTEDKILIAKSIDWDMDEIKKQLLKRQRKFILTGKF